MDEVITEWSLPGHKAKSKRTDRSDTRKYDDKTLLESRRFVDGLAANQTIRRTPLDWPE